MSRLGLKWSGARRSYEYGSIQTGLYRHLRDGRVRRRASPGANDRVRLGIIGAGDRGLYLMREANRAGNIEWVAVCDAWDQRRDGAEQTAGGEVATRSPTTARCWTAKISTA